MLVRAVSLLSLHSNEVKGVGGQEVHVGLGQKEEVGPVWTNRI